MTSRAPRSFGAQLKALRESSGYTQEELATIAGLSVHAVSALERGERRRPHVETVRALAAALDLTGATRDAFMGSARATAPNAAADELSGVAVPVPPTAIVGREADLATVREWLSNPAVRLLTLTGPGGVGKTRLALEIAQTIAADGATRVAFVALATIRDPASVAPAIGEALGLSDLVPRDLAKRCRLACANRPTFVVLDNFEHVLAAAPLVAELLSSVASLRVLVTSRAPLRVRGEREYAVGPLALEGSTDAAAPADLARMPAVRLFVERVRDVRPDFRLTPASGPTVTAICRRLDGLPLALELAAPWLKVLTAEDLLHRLEHDVLSATVSARDLPERQQTLNATVAWSYQLLGPHEQHAFRRFGALPGRFPIEAGAAVLGGDGAAAPTDRALGAVAGLIDKSLLVRAETLVPTRPLYQMLETVRTYAEVALTAAGEQDDALEGLARYCSGEAVLAAQGLVGPAQVEWLHRVHGDLDNYRAALTRLIERGRPADACRLAWDLLFFWLIRGHGGEGLRWYEQILNRSSLPPAAEARALIGGALLLFTQRELARAHSGVSRALALVRDAGDVSLEARAEDLIARIEHALGNVAAAREHFARSVERFHALGIQWGAGNALIGMAGVALATGDDAEAERLLDDAVSELRHTGPWFLARALFVRAILAMKRGHADETIALVRDSLTRIRDLQDKYLFMYALVPLAAAALRKGDAAWAARILGARDAVSLSTGATVVRKAVHDLREETEREARARLGQDRWAVAYAAGHRTSIDTILNEIDNVV